MCDRTDGSYYLCDECLDELIILGTKTDVREFIQSRRPSDMEREASEMYFKTLFKDLD
jgi:hypothetical protein